MRAIRLPSGNYRVRVYIGELAGKKQFISVTEKTEREAMRRALAIQARQPSQDSFDAALEAYIASKTPVLSPATILGYRNMQKRLRKDFRRFCAMPIYAIQKADVQNIINSLLASGKTPKTARNFNGLISATLRSKDVILGQITLPKKYPAEIAVPTMDEVKAIIAETRGTELEIPVLLAAFAGLRRGEACALEWSDIDFKKNIIHVSRDVVKGTDKKWHTKKPKTAASDRYVELPKKTIKRIEEIGELPSLNPHALTNRFARVMKKMGLSYHFHSLRHFCVSYLHSLGIPDSYIMQRCGFENDAILKAIYRHTLADQEKAFTNKANKAFSTF